MGKIHICRFSQPSALFNNRRVVVGSILTEGLRTICKNIFMASDLSYLAGMSSDVILTHKNANIDTFVQWKIFNVEFEKYNLVFFH